MPQPSEEGGKKILKHVAFIRHGESKGNEAYRLHGRDMWTFDAELTDLGREQATRLKECVEKLPVELVVVSPLTRALQTCLIAFGDRVGKVPFVVHPVAKEQMTASDDVGRHYEELEKDFPMLSFDLLKKEPTIWWYTDGKGKEGETIEEFRERFKQQGVIEEPMEVLMERVREFEKWLLAQPQQVVAVVSHGDFILALTGQDLRNAQLYSLEASDHILKQDA